jgi:hypothetical protein
MRRPVFIFINLRATFCALAPQEKSAAPNLVAWSFTHKMIAKRWKVLLQGLVCVCCLLQRPLSSINYYYLFAHNASAAPLARVEIYCTGITCWLMSQLDFASAL